MATLTLDVGPQQYSKSIPDAKLLAVVTNFLIARVGMAKADELAAAGHAAMLAEFWRQTYLYWQGEAQNGRRRKHKLDVQQELADALGELELLDDEMQP